jgi:cell division protein FtsQ
MSVKHIIKRTLLLLSIPAIIGAWFVANYFGKKNPLQAVKISISQNKDGQFITEKGMFTDLITNKNIVVKATSIENVDVKEIEAVAKNNPWVKTAEAYINNSGTLHINITQREPVLRLISAKGSHYYLDSSANIIPLNGALSVNVPVLSVNDLGMSVKDQNLKKQAVTLCSFICKDTFWDAMISQISITDQSDFELTTSIADHTILIGDTSNLADKFNRLLLFYKQAVPKVGYDAYAVLNVKNVGQLVGVKNVDGESNVVQNTSETAPAKSNSSNVLASSLPSKPAVKKVQQPIVKPVLSNATKINNSKTVEKKVTAKTVLPKASGNKSVSTKNINAVTSTKKVATTKVAVAKGATTKPQNKPAQNAKQVTTAKPKNVKPKTQQ